MTNSASGTFDNQESRTDSYPTVHPKNSARPKCTNRAQHQHHNHHHHQTHHAFGNNTPAYHKKNLRYHSHSNPTVRGGSSNVDEMINACSSNHASTSDHVSNHKAWNNQKTYHSVVPNQRPSQPLHNNNFQSHDNNTNDFNTNNSNHHEYNANNSNHGNSRMHSNGHHFNGSNNNYTPRSNYVFEPMRISTNNSKLTVDGHQSQDNDSEQIQRKFCDTEIVSKHPLQTSWCLYLMSNRQSVQVSWNDKMKAISEFNSVEGFWCSMYNSNHSLGNGDYYLFRKGILPDWYDPVFLQGGGRFVVQLPHRLEFIDDVWLYVALRLIGETFDSKEDDTNCVCGAVAVCRQKSVKIALWVSSGMSERLLKVGKEFVDGVTNEIGSLAIQNNKQLQQQDVKTEYEMFYGADHSSQSRTVLSLSEIEALLATQTVETVGCDAEKT